MAFRARNESSPSSSSLTLLQGLLAEHVLAGDKLTYYAIANAFEKR